MRRCTNRRVCSRHFFACCSCATSSRSMACLSNRHGQTQSHCRPTATAVGGHNACAEFASQVRSRNPAGEPPGRVIPLQQWTWHRARVPDFLHTVHRCAVGWCSEVLYISQLVSRHLAHNSGGAVGCRMLKASIKHRKTNAIALHRAASPRLLASAMQRYILEPAIDEPRLKRCGSGKETVPERRCNAQPKDDRHRRSTCDKPRCLAVRSHPHCP